MHNLINFLRKNSHWFTFIFLEIICFYFIFSTNSFQKSVFFNSSNEVTGRVYAISGGFLSYFGLRTENQELLIKNAELQAQIAGLKNYIYDLENDSLKTNAFISDSLGVLKQQNIIARVENNTISQIYNFIIINKGKNDGVQIDMGVVSQQGIVGVVRDVTPNYAVIQPVLNPHSRFSCKILNSNTAGTLVWEGGDPRYANLTEYPKYEKVEKGDTIVTSGFSDIFPEGIFVGIIEDFKSETNDNFYSLKVKLSTDFGALKSVLLLGGKDEEHKELEQKIKNVQK
ncbi:rod shape-determining protein MreC [Dysgonomonas sp. 521]|uniref:rod shape-determining protein MreC n=1 Tax=Dysgonomonas sp. 521 TaxID=2302932 RepID=UPI0013D1C0C3|nr:rod shape-determining protein MreC [Dysgonomonas sp. 521]NDV94302.1 rod shape-determining protein MreC [Dysgonomonas sp. 521]